MADDSLTLRSTMLTAGGFLRLGSWEVTHDGILRFHGEAAAEPGVYAFTVDGIVQYVGVASVSLAKRLYLYGRPGRTQFTNLRLNALMKETLASGSSIEVFAAHPPDLRWNGWAISGAEGLEAGIIRRYRLPWNKKGAISDPAIGSPAPISAEATAIPAAELEDQWQITVRLPARGDKYGPLREFLQECGRETVSMTFDQIQELVGQLPKSASAHRAWWANHEGNSQAKGWMPARYLAEPNPAGQSVIFRKSTAR